MTYEIVSSAKTAKTTGREYQADRVARLVWANKEIARLTAELVWRRLMPVPATN